ncbi:MAG: major facilitator superfamily 1 [Nocardioides sp.]|jgi:MFS family permease|uniref:MFS transporter n=1 Tax=Nocardioides sp. TaxID=35761 RepID=UPI002626178F|nr:MFS transporter [Nocardioides sp.]MCW2832951.1 major facilitator superfamily 1 [Nocardioides sp.]
MRRTTASGGNRGQALPAPVGVRFVATYALAVMSVALILIAPLLVTLALKIRSLVGADQAPESLALVTGVGGLLALVAGPIFGRLSDRTSSRSGMRRPWLIGGLLGGVIGITVVAVAPSLVVVLVGWCLAQLFFNALQAALVAVLPDQVPATQRGTVSGVLGITVPVAAVLGTFLVQLFTGHMTAMFLAPCAIGAALVLLFVVLLDDRRLSEEDARPWSVSDVVTAFHLDPRRHPDFAWALAGRFLFVCAFALLTTYQAYYLLDRIGSAEADVPAQVFRATLVQSAVLVVASLVGGRLSDRIGRRKVFVVTAAVTYGAALFVVAMADTFGGFLVGMAVSGLGFGAYMAVDVALVADVLPDAADSARDLAIFNMANALPFALAPAVAPVILAVSGDSYGVLYAVAGACALLAAAAVVPIRGVR